MISLSTRAEYYLYNLLQFLFNVGMNYGYIVDYHLYS